MTRNNKKKNKKKGTGQAFGGIEYSNEYMKKRDKQQSAERKRWKSLNSEVTITYVEKSGHN